ncbi:unnamed protein product [Schistosoma margrebowiei]|uniref:phosphoenolpyruvate carboxykinase (GTP) n=1 Tax=Schistosoma margrebowiei TaxID=48269 RepID=A0AA85APN8_9TREM|nr:unnamed protein product [Schistosoma margrebowiei]
MWTESSESPCLGSVPVIKGKFEAMPKSAQRFVAKWVEICKPTGVYICDGSKEEREELTKKLVELGSLHKLPPYENNYITCTDPSDVARVESKTWICSEHKHDTVPDVAPGVKGVLGQWISPNDLNTEIKDRYPGCMEGRVLYVIPFSMGPIGSPLSKVGIEITDSIYVVLCMIIMTRMHPDVWKVIESSKEFVRCVHSVGCPTSSHRKIVNHWPCNPEKTLISHVPKERLIMSFGSGYGGNSLLGKKCFALRIAGCIAHDEGWLAEHMLIMSVTNPKGEEKFIAAAFPSACGKTNMAMLEPSLPGWKVQCVGDDIAWMRFDEHGVLRAINPEAGFFGVAPGTNAKTNPNAMATCMKNTVFTNIAQTKDGHIFWEGLEDQYSPDTEIITWLGDHVKLSDKSKDPKAHPNSRFCCPANQCPIIHPKWEDPKGVPISAIIFGGRRPEGIPLVLQSFDWKHGVMLGAALKSEATAAAEFKGKQVMHDPMAMRPFVGYNFGHYLNHWLSMEKPSHKMPLIYHVNWFRLNKQGKFVWPGFGQNIRVIDWILRRVNGEDIGVNSPIGILPKKGSINFDGINVDWDENFSLPKDYLLEDVDETMKYLHEQVGKDLPAVIQNELNNQRERIQSQL